MTASSFSGNIQNIVKDLYQNYSYNKNGSSELQKGYLRYFNLQLFSEYNPDINGYALVFMKLPPFKLLTQKDGEYLLNLEKFLCFSAVDYTPPQREVQGETTSARTGGIPYATEVSPTRQCSATFIETNNLDIYNFHNAWVQYMHDLLEGYIEISPGHEYLDFNSGNYGALDYAGSIFFVRFDHSLNNIKYIGKGTGIFPQSLPTKELIGQRTSNELTTLPFNYFCAFYDETLKSDHPIWKELENDILSAYN